MNALISVNHPITSMQIAEVTGKRHDHILRDIKDEIAKLRDGGISTEPKFGVRARMGITGEIPYYELSKEGVIQIAARYDAVVRAKLIELVMSQDKPQSIEDLIIMQAQSMKELRGQVYQLESTTKAIKETIITQPDKWREDINKMINRIAITTGNDQFRKVRLESYEKLESRARVDLTRRLDNLRVRMLKQGASKSAINNACKMDLIESDPKLREIYSKIIQEYYIKYVA